MARPPGHGGGVREELEVLVPEAAALRALGAPDLPTGGQTTKTRFLSRLEPGSSQGRVPSEALGRVLPAPASPWHWLPCFRLQVPVLCLVTQLHPVDLTPRGPSCGAGAPSPVCLL